MNQELRNLVLGALLHDIGKFRQRAAFEEDEGKTHVQIGHSWLVSQYGEGLIAAGARNHHGNEPETWETNLGLIFYEADNCSASERCEFDPQRDVGQAWHRAMRLGNVFGHVRDPSQDYTVEGNNSPHFPPASYWPLQPLGGWIQPDQEEAQENTAKDYRRLWENFEREFEVLKEVGNHLNIDVMLHLLEKYTAFIPSITLKIQSNTEEGTYRKHPDVSLFDHLKLAAGVASCLWQYHRTVHRDRWEGGRKEDVLKDEITARATWEAESTHRPFLLIGGDLSGVQKFLYTISAKGALKSLKGRSFFLELFTEHVVDRLLEAMGITRCNVIFTGGGHFYLIAPNTQQALESLEGIKEEINTYLLEDFGGTLWQALASIPFGKITFKNPTEVWQALSTTLEAAKRQKWGNRLANLLEAPEGPDPTCETSNCAVCGREDLPLTERDLGDVCGPCWMQHELGKNLRRAIVRGEHPVIYRWDHHPPAEHAERAIQIGSQYYQPSPGEFGRERTEIAASASAVFHLNEWDLTRLTHAQSRPLLVATYLFKGEMDEDPPDLEELIKGGFGLDRLGVVRLDVDRLGKVFTDAVPKTERTFSRMASLSRNLSLFFKYHVNGVLQVERQNEPQLLQPTNVATRQEGPGLPPRRLAVVYSGGDDMFLIGHWLDVTEAAFDIREAFLRFTGNRFITISAGVALGGTHEPVYRLAEAAGEAEAKAKAEDPALNKSERDSITLFGNRPMKWEEALKVRDLVQAGYGPLLEKAAERHLVIPPWSFSRGFLYRVLTLSRDSLGLGPTKEKTGVLVLPKLAYLIGRGGPNEWVMSPEAQEAWLKVKDCLVVWPAEAGELSYRQLEIATMWTLMLLRK